MFSRVGGGGGAHILDRARPWEVDFKFTAGVVSMHINPLLHTAGGTESIVGVRQFPVCYIYTGKENQRDVQDRSSVYLTF